MSIRLDSDVQERRSFLKPGTGSPMTPDTPRFSLEVDSSEVVSKPSAARKGDLFTEHDPVNEDPDLLAASAQATASHTRTSCFFCLRS